MRSFITKIFAGIAVLTTALPGYGQQDTTRTSTYADLSLKDLLNVKIVSASKKSELLFDAPLSASVITKEDIRKAGSTSIMEALRLVPGMIVREQSNGNYDIHLRGMDNVPPNQAFDITSNTTTLVMIDNRPVYSYLRGGTFWETLPVDLNDVEKIEVIRGPSAALYGPNAVNGVINIITRQANKDGLYLVANMQQGSNLTYVNNISTGYRFNEKLNIIASGNYQARDRAQLSYFEFNRNRSFQYPAYFLNFTGDTIHNVDQRYPDEAMSMDKYAGNLFVNYEPAEKTKFNISVGAQHSLVQRVSTENEATPLSTASSNTRYADLRATVSGLSAQVSYNGGTQATDADPGRKYDFSITGANLEYNFGKNNFSLKPGLGYTNAVYDDRKYSDLFLNNGLFNARGNIVTKTASLRAEYKLLNNRLRLIAGVSSSTFNHPDTSYLAYQFAATYKLNKKHLFRAVYSRAPRSSTIFDTYVTKTIFLYPTGPNHFLKESLEGNPNAKLLTANMAEIGYRGNITKKLDVDIEIFSIRASNYISPTVSRPYNLMNGNDTITVWPIRTTNIPAILNQKGITVSLTWNEKKFQARPFITIQDTKAKNYAAYANTADAATPDAAVNNIYSGMGTSTQIKSTPSVFGGASVNYAVLPKLNFGMTAYYYSSQVYYHVTNIIFNDGIHGIDTIKAKLILNANVSYMPIKGLHFFCSAKNILGNQSREFFHTDRVPFMLLGGINYEF